MSLLVNSTCGVVNSTACSVTYNNYVDIKYMRMVALRSKHLVSPTDSDPVATATLTPSYQLNQSIDGVRKSNPHCRLLEVPRSRSFRKISKSVSESSSSDESVQKRKIRLCRTTSNPIEQRQVDSKPILYRPELYQKNKGHILVSNSPNIDHFPRDHPESSNSDGICSSDYYFRLQTAKGVVTQQPTNILTCQNKLDKLSITSKKPERTACSSDTHYPKDTPRTCTQQKRSDNCLSCLQTTSDVVKCCSCIALADTVCYHCYKDDIGYNDWWMDMFKCRNSIQVNCQKWTMFGLGLIFLPCIWLYPVFGGPIELCICCKRKFKEESSK